MNVEQALKLIKEKISEIEYENRITVGMVEIKQAHSVVEKFIRTWN